MKKEDIETLESIYYGMKKGYDIHLNSYIGKKLIKLIDSEKAKIEEDDVEDKLKDYWEMVKWSFESLDKYQKLKIKQKTTCKQCKHCQEISGQRFVCVLVEQRCHIIKEPYPICCNFSE